jgi:hypothetical protein
MLSDRRDQWRKILLDAIRLYVPALSHCKVNPVKPDLCRYSRQFIPM